MLFFKKALILIILLVIFLLIPLSVKAETFSLEEVSLSNSDSYNAAGIYIAENGNVIVVDDKNELWRIDPITGAYSKFLIGGNNLADITFTPDGIVWWSDNTTNFGYLDLNTNGIHFSSIDITKFNDLPLNIGPIVYSDSIVWLASWAVTNYGLFSIEGSEICLYKFPTGLYAADLIASGGFIWGVDWHFERLFKFDPVGLELRFFESIGDIGQLSNMQSEGDIIWWTEDKVNGKIISFDTYTESLISYNLFAGSHPRNLYIKDGVIWFSDVAGGIGRLDLKIAESEPANVSKLNVGIIKPDCSTISYSEYTSTPTTGIFDWGDLSSTITSPQLGLDYYSLPPDAEPYGIGISNNNVWVSDRGRQKLIRMQPEVGFKVFLPLMTK